jgi:hypothetical protein
MSEQPADLLRALPRPLRLAVVGHTNTGKTSLLRTLSRNARFGEVSFHPGTTRHVEAVHLIVGGQVVLELYDTPGIEDPIALLELLETLGQPGERLDGPERVRRFLALPVASRRFEQEAKVLRHMLQCDAAIYVIDARDPVLAKHRDELSILHFCGIPLLPLLNFLADGQARETAWRQALAGVGLHAIVRFDTVAPAQDGERLLYEKLATLLDTHRNTLTALIASHAADALQRHQAALALLAALLINVAACRKRVASDAPAILSHAIGALNQQVRQQEQQCIDTLLSLYRFSAADLAASELPMDQEGRWQQDLFDPTILQEMGLKIAPGAAAGAMAGLGIDLMFGGMTLGAAAAWGALAGGGLQTLRHFGQSLLDSFTGTAGLQVSDTILRLLATRQLRLIEVLEGRGHAATTRIDLEKHPHGHITPSLLDPWATQLPQALRRARANPEWCEFDTAPVTDEARLRAVQSLTEELNALWPA